MACLWGCSSSGNGGSPSDATPMTQTTQACVGFDGCTGTQMCTGKSCDDCYCPSAACVSAEGCAGTQVCRGQTCAGGCECTAAGTSAWKVDGTGTALGVAGAPDGTAYVRLSGAPWLIAYSSAGQITPLNLPLALAWVEQFIVTSDGNLLLAGGNPVRVVELSPAGAVLNDTTWPATLMSLSALSKASNGAIYALAYGAALPVDNTGAPGASTSLGSDGFAADPAGDFLLYGPLNDNLAQSIASVGLLKVGAKVQSIYSQPGVESFCGTAADDGRGGWFYTVLEVDRYNGEVYADLYRASGAGGELWSTQLSYTVQTGSVPPSAFYAWTLPLADSAVLAFKSPDGTAFERVAYDGVVLESGGTAAAAIGAAVAGPQSLVLLEGAGDQRYTLERWNYAALTPTKAPAGASCAMASECSSNVCCAGISGGQCTDGTKCPAGDQCASPTDCLGTCVLPTSGPGFCALTCSQNADCGDSGFCISGTCLRSCGDTACPFGARCTGAKNVDGVAVMVCGYP